MWCLNGLCLLGDKHYTFTRTQNYKDRELVRMIQNIIYNALGEEKQEINELYQKLIELQKNSSAKRMFITSLTIATELHIINVNDKENFLDVCSKLYDLRTEDIKRHLQEKQSSNICRK